MSATRDAIDTLAALVEEINRRDARHIITVEDPIEYDHPHGRSIIEQVEIGIDTADFPAALAPHRELLRGRSGLWDLNLRTMRLGAHRFPNVVRQGSVTLLCGGRISAVRPDVQYR